MSEFFTASAAPQNSGPGSSIDIRAEFTAVEAGFDKLGSFSTIASQLIGVNAGGTGLEGKGPYAVDNWTPVFTFVTPGDLAIVYAGQVGKYIRIGGLVIAFFYLDMTTFTFTTGSGAAKITGLPFPEAMGTMPGAGAGPLHLTNVTFAGLHITPYATGSVIQFNGAASAASDTTIGAAHFLTGSGKKVIGYVGYLA